MTTEPSSTAATSEPSSGDSASGHNRKTLLRGPLSVLGSARVTSALLVASMILVLLGTLAQVHMDIWQVVHDYFRSWVAWVDLKVLFPPTFFPWAARTDWDSLSIQRFPFPGGAMIGLALVINLMAAHGVRFKTRVRGPRLAGGLLTLAIGAVVTWLVIETGHNRQGVQGEPFLAPATLWILLRVCLLGLFGACLSALLYVAVRVKRKRTVELIVLGLFTLGLGSLLGWVLLEGDAAVLNDSSLRILYRLIQGELAALVLLVGCVLLFQKRAGIALLHGGIALLMFSEFFVSYYAEEQQMTLTEGQTISYTRDIRSVEMAITTLVTGTREGVVVVPMVSKGKPTRYTRGGTIALEGLPFDAEIIRFDKNSTLRGVKPGEKNLATAGMGERYIAEATPPQGSVQRGGMDMASLYVKLTDRKTGEDLGTFLLSQHFSSMRILMNSVGVSGKGFGLGLRFKRYYKPYELTLIDVRKDDYVGTSMPRNYSSRVKLKDPTRNVDLEANIWMNNPLRYAGETFYQSGYNRGRGGKESSTLQVVKNTGWMIPYVSCMIVATGMLAHFFVILLAFLRRVQTGSTAENPSVPASESGAEIPVAGAPVPAFARWAVPLAVVILGALFLASKGVSPRREHLQIDLDQFGALPLMYEGRVKPFDTLARNSLRILSGRETFVDSNGQKQPAIRWLLDLIAQPTLAERHAVFRIDSTDVLETFGLERRKGSCYSWAELRGGMMEFQKQMMLAGKQPAEARTFQQRKLLQLNQRLHRYRLLSDAFRPLPFRPFPSKEETAKDRAQAVKTVVAIGRLMKQVPAMNRSLAARQPPLAAPTSSSDAPWEAFAIARNNAYVAQNLNQKKPSPELEKLSAVFETYRDGNAAAFNQAVADYKGLLASKPPAGYDPSITTFEASFNRFAPFYNAIPLYGLALLLTVFSWLAALGWPRVSALLRSTTFWLIVLAFVVHTLALGARVMISGRPPVTNLYSSAVFVGWGCVAIGLLLELVFRLGIGNLVASIAGIGTLIIAHQLAGDGDTIKVLQAVLDTQFWLTVHVITVTLGYSATFLAGLLGLVLIAYLLAKSPILWLTGATRRAHNRRPQVDRLPSSDRLSVVTVLGAMIYGTVCFAAVFSLVGTVLGGLWADDSWGRFWGWDPKENGALMVVLWNALVLHARSARLVKERGLALLAIGGNIVTAWSWFGVNELGVGLHSYGFTEGAAEMLWLFWFSQLAVIALGLLLVLIGKVYHRGPHPEPAA